MKKTTLYALMLGVWLVSSLAYAQKTSGEGHVYQIRYTVLYCANYLPEERKRSFWAIDVPIADVVVTLVTDYQPANNKSNVMREVLVSTSTKFRIANDSDAPFHVMPFKVDFQNLEEQGQLLRVYYGVTESKEGGAKTTGVFMYEIEHTGKVAFEKNNKIYSPAEIKNIKKYDEIEPNTQIRRFSRHSVIVTRNEVEKIE